MCHYWSTQQCQCFALLLGRLTQPHKQPLNSHSGSILYQLTQLNKADLSQHNFLFLHKCISAFSFLFLRPFFSSRSVFPDTNRSVACLLGKNHPSFSQLFLLKGSRLPCYVFFICMVTYIRNTNQLSWVINYLKGAVKAHS